MHILPKHYQDLHSGLSRIRTLNKRYQDEWRPFISRWNQAADQEYARMWAESEKAREKWTAIQNQVRPKKQWGWILLILAMLFICPGFCLLPFGGDLSFDNLLYYLSTGAIMLLGIAMAVYGLQLLSRANTVERQVASELLKNPLIQFDPKRPRSLPNPLPPARRASPFTTELTGLWWKQIELEAEKSQEVSKWGDLGEMDLMDELNRILPSSYYAVRGLMVADTLDIDILLFGPTGIWNLESKYVSGEVTYAYGQWRRKKVWVENGIQQQKDEILKDLHSQWLRERELLEKHLRKFLPEMNVRIKGGLVFTLRNVTLRIDPNIPVSVGTTAAWIRKICASPNEPGMTEDILLRAFDALLTTSQSIKSQPFRSSIHLAEMIYQQEAEAMRRYAKS